MRREKVKGRAGAFWGGTFIGFLLTLALLAGIGCLIYFKASVKLINKTFKTDISLGSDELNGKTINQLVADISGIVKNKETYSLNDFEKDFGLTIKDTLLGIKIADLKSVGFSKLPDAIEKKFGAISANELRSVSGMNLEEEMGHILKQTSTYYYKSADGKLYEKLEGATYSKEVAFDYEIIEEGGEKKVVTKDHKTTIEDGVAQIQLWYLPLTSALGDFTANMGTNLTLKVLETDFGIKLPTFFDNVDKENTTINQLESAINTLYIADFLGYTVDDTDPDNLIVKDKNNTVVTGLMANLATTKIDELDDSDFTERLGEDLTLDDLKTSFGVTLPSFFDNIDTANTTIKGLENAINNLYIADLLGYSTNGTIVKDENQLEVTGFMKTIALQKISEIGEGGLQTTINNLHIADFLGYTVNGTTVEDGDGDEVDGFMKTIALQKISDLDEGGLENTINNMLIAELLGLTIKNEGGVEVVYDGTNKVEGVLATVAKFKVNELKEGVKSLKLTDVFATEDMNSGVLSLIDHPETVSIDNIPNAIQNAIQTKTVRNLFDAGVIQESELSATTKKVLTTSFDHDGDVGTDDITLDSFTMVELLDVLGNKVILSKLVIILNAA